jgi:oligopeptide transport system permease protein
MRGLRLPMTALAILLGFFLLGTLVGGDPATIRADASLSSPNWTHWLGTDELGRDVFARLAMAAQLSLWIGLATGLLSSGIGLIYGSLAAQMENRWPDKLLMGFVQVLYSLPGLMLVILFSLFLGRGVMSLVLALSLFSWPDTARMIRVECLRLKREEFASAYHVLGGGTLRLYAAHLWPNMGRLLLLATTMTIPRAILTEATLSFVGLGVPAPLSSWGTMIQEGWQVVRLAPHLMLWPLALLLLSMSCLFWLSETVSAQLGRSQTV